MAANEAELRAFLEAAGQSLSGAQGKLGEDIDLSPSMVIANAELEVKAAVQADTAGQLSVQPISAKDIREGGIDPGMLSTLRVNFVATAGELPAPAAQAPQRQADEVVEEVKAREDVAALDRILGGLDVEATFVPEKRRWLVTARDAKARLVREVVLPDETTEGKRG